MSNTLILVSDPIKARVNLGAYDRPFSGVGIEYDPLGVKPGRTGITLHETGYLPANDRWNFPATFSPFWRMYYNPSPGHVIIFRGRTIELTPDRLVLIPPHCLFHSLGSQPAAHFWITFSFTHQLEPDQDLPVCLPPRDTELCLIRDLSELVLANTGWQPTDVIYRNSLALLHVVLSRPELRWRSPPPEHLDRVRRHIEAHLDTRMSMAGLAVVAGLSPAGFNRAFKRHFGTSPARFVAEMRVREAARLLLTTRQTIDDIAEETGFPNRAYFSRVFKQITDEAPAGFRRRHRGPLD